MSFIGGFTVYIYTCTPVVVTVLWSDVTHVIGEPECEPTRPLRFVATLSGLRSCMADTGTRVGEYVKFGLNAIIVVSEIPTELAFKYHKYYSCNLSRKNAFTNCQWENGISWRKHS